MCSQTNHWAWPTSNCSEIYNISIVLLTLSMLAGLCQLSKVLLCFCQQYFRKLAQSGEHIQNELNERKKNEVTQRTLTIGTSQFDDQKE